LRRGCNQRIAHSLTFNAAVDLAHTSIGPASRSAAADARTCDLTAWRAHRERVSVTPE
jgi:hypothetical protein